MRKRTAIRAASIAESKQSGRGRGGDHRQRRLAVAAVDRHQQVRLFGFRRQPGRGAGALHVDDHQRQLQRHREGDRLGLQVHPRAAGRGHPELAAEGGAERHVGGGDLVLGLDGADAEAVVAGEVVQQFGGGGDRIGREEELQPALDAGRDQPHRHRVGAVDVAVLAGVERRRGDFDRGRRDLGRVAEVVAGLEGGDVGGHDRRLLGELRFQPGDRRLARPPVHPGDQAEGEDVLGPLRLGRLEVLDAVGGARRQRRHRHLEGLVVLDRAVLQRVGLVAGLAQVGGGEGVLVDDQRAARLQRAEVGFERRRVHRHQRVRVVAGGEDVARGEVDLEGGDAARGAGRGADLGREVRQRREVVADVGGGGGEAVADELHTVARVPGEPDDDGL